MIAWHADQMRDHDRGHVFATWKASYRDGSGWHEHFAPGTDPKLVDELYDQHMQRGIERLLSRSRVLVARPEGWAEGILGWVCAQQLVDGDRSVFAVHYAYTKRRLRKRTTGESLCWALIEKLEPRGRLVFTCLRPPHGRTFTNHGYAFAPEYARAREEQHHE